MDENKNQNNDFDFGIGSNDGGIYNSEASDFSWDNAPSYTDDDDDDGDEEDNTGHESLSSDRDIDVNEYEESNNNPILDGYSDTGSFDEEDKEEEKEEKVEDVVTISKSKILIIKGLLNNIKESNEKLVRLLGGLISDEDEVRIKISEVSDGTINPSDAEDGGKIVEGVFDGETMIGPDGRQYSIPSNYASKSKLVEGDLLKLTITPKGTFVYKQIKPIERDRIVGTLEKNVDGTYLVVSGAKKWRVITASVTYFKGDLGDEVIILVPRGSDSKWAAVENIIKNK